MGTVSAADQSLAAGDLKVAIIAARYNEQIVGQLLAGARAAWAARGGSEAALRIERVPGAFELPLAARELALSGAFNAVVALGCVIRGETAHFEYVAGECARGLQQVMLQTGVPVSFGVLTTETLQQAEQRAAPGPHNKGAEAIDTAIAMAQLLRRI
jgi:6,7-dimethyl-8-ribityllumazine synthase